MMTALVYDIRPMRWVMCKLAGWISPAAYWSRLSGLRLREVGIPPLPSPQWVRLRPILGGICGTDIAAITQRHHPANILQIFSSRPAVVGHENVSIVDEVGAEVTRWKPGDRVVVEPSLSCVPRGISPVCTHCAAGRFTLCDNFVQGPLPAGAMIGWNSFTGGSWAPCFVAHESQLYRVPANLSDEEALLTDPVSGALHAVLRCRPDCRSTVLILGAGLLGLGVAAAIKALDIRSRVVAMIRHESQRAWFERFGVQEIILVGRGEDQAARYGKVAGHIGGRILPSKFGHHAFIGGFDIVYDCIGTGATLTDAMKYARAGGTVVEVGTSQITLVDTAPLWFDELNLVGANGRAIETYNGRRMHTYEVLWELAGQQRVDLKGLLTHRYRIEQYREAFATLAARGRTGAIKVAFEQPPG